MSESLWADIDQWLISYLSARLMDAGLYPTLTAKMVVATLVRDIKEWDNADVWQFPAIIIAGSRQLRPPSGVTHANAAPGYRKPVLYRWLAVVEGDSFTSERDAKILEKRMELAARDLVRNGWGMSATIPLAHDTSGERMSQINLGESNIARYPRSSEGDLDPWFGVATIDLDFITTLP